MVINWALLILLFNRIKDIESHFLLKPPKMMDYQFAPCLLLRSPFFSYLQYNINQTENILHDQYFQTALYLASPQLYQMLAAKNFEIKDLTTKEQVSILRYYNRMSFRPTPFGSFSSYTTVRWELDAPIRLDKEENAWLHVNFDQEAVLQLADGLNEYDVSQHLYHCNPALYKAGLEFRFIKTNYTPEKKHASFALESYEYNKVTADLIVFCQHKPRNGQAMTDQIIELTGCSLESALDYLDFLVNAQIIVPETAINITGEDYLQRLLNHPDTTVPDFKQKLQTIYQRLQAVPFPSAAYLIKITDDVNHLLLDLAAEKISQSFYAGLERKVLSGGVAIQYQQQILNGLKASQCLVQPISSLHLQQFIRDFKNRYDRQKIPLLLALDPETGISYGEQTRADVASDLLKKVNFNNRTEGATVPLDWSPVHRLLLKRWNQNPHTTDPILLNDHDLLTIQPNHLYVSSPPSLSVIFRPVDDHVFLETIGGVSATALIGRFTYWSDDIHTLSKELASREQVANPAIIFAEIGQVSDTHADNINRRKHCYAYEIPVNSVSTLPLAQQIALSDLLISVADDKLILESISLQKVIIPRLSSAYNYNHNDLSIFRLLCDLQHQGLQSNYTFDLEHYFPGMGHYPRVVFNQTILCAAKWYLSAEDLKHINGATKEETYARFTLIREKKGLPSHIALTKFDQQLVFNIDRKEEVHFLLDCLKGLDQVMIQEFCRSGQPCVTTHDGKPLISQFIAFLYQDEMVYSGFRPPDAVLASKIKQEYIIGSRWLYLKLYCNPSVANDLLVKKLLPLLKQFDRKDLKSWFFIRYRDSGYHIRLRLNVREQSIGTLLTRLKIRLADTVHIHLIREYQADTYRRELERYGPDIIGLVEDFFHASSELIIRYIKVSGLKSAKYTYHSLAFVSVAHLLNSFLPQLHEQLIFLEQMVQTFYAELSNDKTLKIDLDQKYRELKTEITGLLIDSEYYKKQKLTPESVMLTLKINEIQKPVAGFTAKRKTQLLADLIHMHLNRLFIDQQRNQELIVYYCLYKHQLSIKVIADKNRS